MMSVDAVTLVLVGTSPAAAADPTAGPAYKTAAAANVEINPSRPARLRICIAPPVVGVAPTPMVPPSPWLDDLPCAALA
jgi:hypothetical protein